MDYIKTIKREKSDYKDLEKYVIKNELVDDKKIWFAGFYDVARGTQNAVARNLFYGNSRLVIITIKEDSIFLLRNSKEGFKLYLVGKISDKYRVYIKRNLIHPSIEIQTINDENIRIQATKNKHMVRQVKKIIK